MALNIKPLADRVIVAPMEQEMVKGSIIIPDTAKEKPQQGKIVATGPGTVSDSGERVAPEVGDSDKLGNGGNVPFSIWTSQAFSHVEEEVDLRLAEARGKVVDRLEEGYLAKQLQRIADGVDGVSVIPLDVCVSKRLEGGATFAVVDGDTFFPEFDTEEWHLEEDAWHSADKRHGFAYSFRLYLRRARLE